jgi:hypothetical protein
MELLDADGAAAAADGRPATDRSLAEGGANLRRERPSGGVSRNSLVVSS